VYLYVIQQASCTHVFIMTVHIHIQHTLGNRRTKIEKKNSYFFFKQENFLTSPPVLRVTDFIFDYLLDKPNLFFWIFKRHWL